MKKSSRICLLLLSIVGLFVSPVFAEKIKITYKPEYRMSYNQMYARALQQAYSTAFVTSARQFLPQNFSAKRLKIMEELYRPSAERFVKNYKKGYSATVENGLELEIDAEMNVELIYNELESLGFLDTRVQLNSSRVEYGEGLKVEKEMTQNIQRAVERKITTSVLPVLNFFDVVEAPWAMLTILVENKNGIWIVRATAEDDKVFIGKGKNFFAAWTTVWKKLVKYIYPAQEKGRATLEITGWYTPTGVQDVDKLVRSWNDSIRNTEFLSVSFDNEEIQARWSFEIFELEKLQRALLNNIAKKNLRYILKFVEDPNVVKKTNTRQIPPKVAETPNGTSPKTVGAPNEKPKINSDLVVVPTE